MRAASSPRGAVITARRAGRGLDDFAGSEPRGAKALGAGGADASLATALGACTPATAAGAAAEPRADAGRDVRAGAAPLPDVGGEAGRGEGFGAGAGTAVEGAPDFDCLKSSVTQTDPPASTTPTPTYWKLGSTMLR